MIGAPNVHYRFEAPLDELVVVVCDVRSEIGRFPGGLNDHVVFVVTEHGGVEPLGAVPFRDVVIVVEDLQGGVVLAPGEQCALAEPVVELHADSGEIVLDGAHHFFPGDISNLYQRLFVILLEESLTFSFNDLLRQIDDVLTLVAVLRHV